MRDLAHSLPRLTSATQIAGSSPVASMELLSGFGSEVESERQAEQLYRAVVICSEVDLLFFQALARASNCDLVGCEVDSVLFGAQENIPAKILIRAWRRKTGTRAQLRRHGLHFTAQFAVGDDGHADLPAHARANQNDRKGENDFEFQQRSPALFCPLLPRADRSSALGIGSRNELTRLATFRDVMGNINCNSPIPPSGRATADKLSEKVPVVQTGNIGYRTDPGTWVTLACTTQGLRPGLLSRYGAICALQNVLDRQ
jgi:hypothetical protein